jgi:hypothetical protein
MIMKEIIDALGSLDVHETRDATNESIELVVCNDQLGEFNDIISTVLGPPRKLPGAKPSEDDLNLTRECGGIWIDQTLFVKEFEDCQVIAMYWPWQSGSFTTLNIVHFRKNKSVGNGAGHQKWSRAA